MKRAIIIGALCCGFAARSHAQALSTYAAELAALQGLEKTTDQGYEDETSGLGQIGDIRQGEFTLHSGYYTGLRTVNPQLIADPKLVELRNQLTRLVARLQNELDYWSNQPTINQQ